MGESCLIKSIYYLMQMLQELPTILTDGFVDPSPATIGRSGPARDSSCQSRDARERHCVCGCSRAVVQRQWATKIGREERADLRDGDGGASIKSDPEFVDLVLHQADMNWRTMNRGKPGDDNRNPLGD